MNDFQNISKENWIIIFLFISLSAFIMKMFPNGGLEWISFVAIALIIALFNSFALSSKLNTFSKNSKKYLIYRILWSSSFSLYVILIEFSLLPNLGIVVILLFYFLAIFDIILNIFIREIGSEVGPGFMPKKII